MGGGGLSGNAYWKAGEGRANLHVVTKALGGIIIFRDAGDEGLTVTGLNFMKYEISYFVNAIREVLISGGTMKAP